MFLSANVVKQLSLIVAGAVRNGYFAARVTRTMSPTL